MRKYRKEDATVLGVNDAGRKAMMVNTCKGGAIFFWIWAVCNAMFGYHVMAVLIGLVGVAFWKAGSHYKKTYFK